MKKNWIIILHDRHCDDRYKIVLNATYDEASQIELEVAKKVGWENEKDAEKYGYGDYGYGEAYWIDLRELDGVCGMNDVITKENK